MDARAVLLLTTMPDDDAAATLAQTLVDERLAACVNVLPPMQSTYRWQERVETAAERQLIMKTTAARLDALKARLEELHPYEVPEILVIDVASGGEAYLAWVAESTSPA